ncbi:MAG TPA: hypothetical protein VIG04_11815 [Gemmatimonadales bacterium]|jgi:hypothetical protein
MRSAYLWSLVLLLTPFGVAGAQRADTNSVRRDSLRHRIEERFTARAQEDLRLTDEQTTKLRATSERFGTRRAELRTRGQQLREALTAQLQPGVAANQDSVAKLTNAMIELKTADAQISRDEIKEQSKYLNPTQRARLYVMRERFTHRLREMHWERGEKGFRREAREHGDQEGHHRGGDSPGGREPMPGDSDRS